jgi:hypothetical protein
MVQLISAPGPEGPSRKVYLLVPFIRGLEADDIGSEQRHAYILFPSLEDLPCQPQADPNDRLALTIRSFHGEYAHYFLPWAISLTLYRRGLILWHDMQW